MNSRAAKAILLVVILGFSACGSREVWEERHSAARKRVADEPKADSGPAADAEVVIHTPRFEAYPVSRIYEGKPLPVNVLSHPQARKLQTRLVEGAKKGPNFAGHYTVVMWGCGTECQQIAVVEARTGIVAFAEFMTRLGAQFRIDSNLLIANPPDAVEQALRAGGASRRYRTVYYLWKAPRFVELYSVEHSGEIIKATTDEHR